VKKIVDKANNTGLIHRRREKWKVIVFFSKVVPKVVEHGVL